MSRIRFAVLSFVAATGLIATVVVAGNLDAPAAPTAPGSAMHTLTEIYNRLVNGAAGSKRSGGFAEPGAGPNAGTMRTLDEIMGKAPAVAANAASPAEVLNGRAFWGLSAGNWGPATGAMANVGAQSVTPGAASQTITQGYHNGAGLVGGDPGLVAANIRKGVAIFGVAGDNSVVNTSSGNATAGEVLAGRKAWVGGVEITGGMANVGVQSFTPGVATQTINQGFHDGSGVVGGDVDMVAGNIRAGVNIFGVTGSATVVDTSPAIATAGEILLDRTAYVNGALVTGLRAGGLSLSGGSFWDLGRRWYKKTDGTVIDCKTGLVWLSSPDSTLRPYLASQGATMDCMRYLYQLCPPQCGLADGSVPGDWDMPTLQEMESLFLPPQAIGSAGSQAFDNTSLNALYWTSTPMMEGYGITSTYRVYCINMESGGYLAENKLLFQATNHMVWPVRRRHRW